MISLYFCFALHILKFTEIQINVVITQTTMFLFQLRGNDYLDRENNNPFNKNESKLYINNIMYKVYRIPTLKKKSNSLNYLVDIL